MANNSLYKLEQFASGRYDVIVQNGMRAGSIIGGGQGSNQSWQAEIGQKVVGQFKSKNRAANEILQVQGIRSFFDQMQDILVKDSSLLQHYKDDFYKIDKEILENWQCATDMLWFVRNSGTNLVELDCAFSERSGMAVLQGFDPKITGSPLHIFHLVCSDMKVKPVSAGKAIALLQQIPPYNVKNHFITRWGKTIAKVEFTDKRIDATTWGTSVTVQCEEVPATKVQAVLRRMAWHALEKEKQTLFAKATSLEIRCGKKRLYFWEPDSQKIADSGSAKQ